MIKDSVSKRANVCKLIINTFRLKTGGNSLAMQSSDILLETFGGNRGYQESEYLRNWKWLFVITRNCLQISRSCLILCLYKLKKYLGTHVPYSQVTLSTHGHKCKWESRSAKVISEPLKNAFILPEVKIVISEWGVPLKTQHIFDIWLLQKAQKCSPLLCRWYGLRPQENNQSAWVHLWIFMLGNSFQSMKNTLFNFRFNITK